MGENVPFWIDTLCIPRNDPDVKKKAILQMRRVYQAACHVLVLDSGLMRTSFHTSSFDEIVMGIANSGWMQRLWTLQESCLAQEVAFVFVDHIMRVKDQADFLAQARDYFDHRLSVTLAYDGNTIRRGESPLSKLYQLINNPIERDKAEKVLKRLQIHVGARPVFHAGVDTICGALGSQKELSVDPVLKIFRSISMRSTSEPGDEALCIALLLNYDIRRILNSSDDIRMSVLLKSTKRIPALVCFFQGPRYDDPRHRWIPRSFLIQNGRLGCIFGPVTSAFDVGVKFTQGRYYGFPTTDGLRVTLPGIKLRTARWASEVLENDYPTEILFKTETLRYRLVLTEGDTQRCRRLDRSAFTTIGAAIILPPSGHAYWDEMGDSATMAILTSVQPSPMRDHIRVQFESNAILHRADIEFNSTVMSYPVSWKGDPDSQLDYLPAEILPLNQTWCLG
jgi:hypothetical protein